MDCPFCKEEIKDNALKCKHCGSNLEEEKEGLKDVFLPRKKNSKKKKNWTLRIAVAASCLLLVGLLSSSGSLGSGKMIFCEKVNPDLSPINEATVFTPGQLTLWVSSDSKFGVDSIILSLYSIKGDTENLVDRSPFQINAGWDRFSYPISLYDKGKYKVVASKPGGDLVAEGTVEIQ